MAFSKPEARRGYFIVFEGPDGSGKSSQLAAMASQLRDYGETVVVTREPGGTPLGDELRSILLDREHIPLTAHAELFLLAAARNQHVTDVIEPALARDAIVLCDRYVDSTYAYQGGGRGLDLESLRSMQQIATGGRWPDVRVLLDVPVDVGLARRFGGNASQVNRLDRADVEFHQRVRDAYLTLARQEPASWIVIDAVPSQERVAREVTERVGERLAQWREAPSRLAALPGNPAPG